MTQKFLHLFFPSFPLCILISLLYSPLFAGGNEPDESQRTFTKKRKTEQTVGKKSKKNTLLPGQAQITDYFSKGAKTSPVSISQKSQTTTPQISITKSFSKPQTTQPQVLATQSLPQPKSSSRIDHGPSPLIRTVPTLRVIAPPASHDLPITSNNKTTKGFAKLNDQRQNRGPRLAHIFGTEDHVDELIGLIDFSKHKLEIFSWTLGFLHEDVFNALREASHRGVEIILTVQDVKRELTHEALEEAGIQVNDGRKTHTKFVIVDEKRAMIGSYNFLGTIDEDKEESLGEASLLITGNPDLVKRLRGRIYSDMIRYEKGESFLNNALQVDLPNDSSFHLLTNVNHHNEFFSCAAQNAKQKFIMYSPFVNYKNALFRLQTLEQKLGSNVFVEIYVLAEQARHLKWALKKCPKISDRTKIIAASSHRKSLVVDPLSDTCHFCEGSFNWLSAATMSEHDASNQETSVVITGPKASELFKSSKIKH